MATKDISALQVCQAASKAFEIGQSLNTLTLLMKKTKQPWKVCLRALERELKRGLVDYGTSIYSAFLTKEGAQLLTDQVLESQNG